MNEQTVKPCPRCNKPLYGIFGPAEGGLVDKMFWAECEGECPYFYAGYTREQCEEAWNRRASPEPSASVRETAEKGVDTYLRAVANKEDFDLYDIFANAFRNFVPRGELEKLPRYTVQAIPGMGQQMSYRELRDADGDYILWSDIDAILRRKP
jgi:hypothetical protein